MNWGKAWWNFKKQEMKSSFKRFYLDKYVTWKDEEWDIPQSFQRRYPQIAREIRGMQIQSQQDQFLWTLHKSGIYTIDSMYEQLRERKEKVRWHRLVWSGKGPQKYKVILWLVLMERLKTKELLNRRGMSLDPNCLLCCSGSDTVHHMFFECEYTSTVWKEVLLRTGIVHTPRCWRLESAWLRYTCKGRSRKSKMIRQALLCTIYSVWLERNGLRR